MKFIAVLLLFSEMAISQISANYEQSSENPFAKLNPAASKEIADYQPLIGTCDCISTTRNPDKSWAKPQKMIWTFKYIMNGTAVQDESIKEDGSHSGSIRQFVADSSKWYVHWYSNTSPVTSLPTWEGKKQSDSIVLYKPQKAPNGMEGSVRLTFSNISDNGFDWRGEWTDTSETFVYLTWTITCTKRKPESALSIISKNTSAFSEAYMKGDIETLTNFYSEDGKIFPNNSDIIAGHVAIKKRWTMPEGVKILYHKVTPSEVNIIDDYAYDYGYYEGKSLSKENVEQAFKGKYVIVWKQVEGDWKIYLDIWNNL